MDLFKESDHIYLNEYEFDRFFRCPSCGDYVEKNKHPVWTCEMYKSENLKFKNINSIMDGTEEPEKIYQIRYFSIKSTKNMNVQHRKRYNRRT